MALIVINSASERDVNRQVGNIYINRAL